MVTLTELTENSVNVTAFPESIRSNVTTIAILSGNAGVVRY
jgi:hypothetical protein